MATVRAEQSGDLLTVDPTSNAARVILCDTKGSTGKKSTIFAALGAGFGNVTTTGTILTLPGSKTKKVEVISFIVNIVTGYPQAPGTTQSSVDLRLIRNVGTGMLESTNVSTPIVVSDDFYNTKATTSVITHGDATPANSLVPVGTINIVRAATSNTVGYSTSPEIASEKNAIEMLPEIGGEFTPITLRGTQEILELSTPTVLNIFSTIYYRITWTEEDY